MGGERAALRRAVVERIGDRRLIWFGTRGDDVESIADIPQLDGALSLINTYRRRPVSTALSLEDLTGVRPDLDTFDIDEHPRAEAVQVLRDELLRVLARPSVVFTYRPTTFLEAVALTRAPRTLLVGLPAGHRSAFDFKPWVESSVAALGVPSVPWRHVADLDQLDVLPLLATGPVVLRRSRTNGGVGIVQLDAPEHLAEFWPDEDEAFVSVAPFLTGTPVNVGAVVWHDGVTVHPASVQLIGMRSLTTRSFGYAGNDFGIALDLGADVLDSMDRSVRLIGNWLRTMGYLGAFGVDFLVTDQGPLFMEVNPRFQGSTHASCQLSIEHDRPCLLLDHLAASFGIDAPGPGQALRSLAAEVGAFAHIVVHNTSGTARLIDPAPLIDRLEAMPGYCRADVLTRPEVVTMPEATVARITLRGRVTTTGFDLLPALRDPIDAVRATWMSAPPAVDVTPTPTLRLERSGRVDARRR